MDVADVLEKAADLYESEQIDWCQHRNYTIDDAGKLSACAQGAIFMAAGLTVRKDLVGMIYSMDLRARYLATASMQLLAKYLISTDQLRTDPLSGPNVPHFNDAPRRTKQQVIDAMKDCAKELRNGAS